MERLIDADVLLLELEEELSHKSPFFTTEQNELIDVGLRIAAGDIRHQPTVDAVEVVRCRDCTFGVTPYGDEHDGWIECSNIHGRPLFGCNDFCSYGERKEGTD